MAPMNLVDGICVAMGIAASMAIYLRFYMTIGYFLSFAVVGLLVFLVTSRLALSCLAALFSYATAVKCSIFIGSVFATVAVIIKIRAAMDRAKEALMSEAEAPRRVGRPTVGL
jgi:hypothetical protein